MTNEQSNQSQGKGANQGQGQSQIPKEVPATTETAKKSADQTTKGERR